MRRDDARPFHLRTLAQKRRSARWSSSRPKDDAGVEALRATAVAVKRMQPDFVSVTYGAGRDHPRPHGASQCALKDELASP